MALVAILSAAGGLLGSNLASAEAAPDFVNPAVVMSSDAVRLSGFCIAKYAVLLDDRAKPAAQIGQQVAKRCAKEISRSAGLASWMTGKPEEFSKNLRYTQEDLTTGAVLRSRVAKQRSAA